VIFNHAQFTRRQQRPGVSITQYVAALKEMAARCEFATSLLRGRVASGSERGYFRNRQTGSWKTWLRWRWPWSGPCRRHPHCRPALVSRWQPSVKLAPRRRQSLAAGTAVSAIIRRGRRTVQPVGSHVEAAEDRDLFRRNAVVLRRQIRLPVVTQVNQTVAVVAALIIESATDPLFGMHQTSGYTG